MCQLLDLSYSCYCVIDLTQLCNKILMKLDDGVNITIIAAKTTDCIIIHQMFDNPNISTLCKQNNNSFHFVIHQAQLVAAFLAVVTHVMKAQSSFYK